jgi:serine/threonine-protein kinase
VSSLAAALSEHYRIERLLGDGGMATVYLAHDLKHDRPVALKLLKPELAHTLGPERFEREIKLAARLQHPHVLTVLDSGEVSVGPHSPGADQSPATGAARDASDGPRSTTPTTLLYFTMPYVEGESLRDRLNREKQLPVDDAVRIAREAALALGYAHEHGVIHRDIKPENLLLTKDGSTLVADFGIARALGRDEDAALTATGTSIGTAAYMSPEQAAGEREVDARSDVYSLAIVLYEMLAGETPFAAPTPQATIARRFTDTPKPLRAIRDSVPTHVEAAVQKALARTTADRFASARHFSDALAPRTTIGGTPVAAPVHKRRVSPVLLALGLGFLVGVGVLFAWRRHQPSDIAADAGARRLAVLPFANVGDSADAYFADGITDAVRGKLTSIQGIEVIAPASSNDYRATTKSPQQIARELGVSYLLQGKVRWARAADGTSRVQVSPMLISAATGAVTWQQPFNASLTDVFQVQADIASQVAGALKLALADSARRKLAERPTQNLAAYDAYLRGEDLAGGGAGAMRRSIAYYEQAVALDPDFALAWAALSNARSRLYIGGVPTPELAAAALQAAEHARALAPDDGFAHSAMGSYLRRVKADYPAAAAEYAAVVRATPGSADALSSLAATYSTMGKWDSAQVISRRALSLDPRSSAAAKQLGSQLRQLRRYEDAAGLLERAAALDSLDISIVNERVLTELGRGDLPAAQTLIATVPKQIDYTELVTYLAAYGDLYWTLTDAQQRFLLRLPPSAYDDDRGTWGLALAGTSWIRGDTASARSYGDSARVAFRKQLEAVPDDPQLRTLYGLSLAYAGYYPDAIREGRRGTELAPLATNHFMGPYLQHQLVKIYVLAGENEQALDLLEPLLKIPYDLSPAWLRIDPAFRSLRGNPRFEKLVAGSASPRA